MRAARRVAALLAICLAAAGAGTWPAGAGALQADGGGKRAVVRSSGETKALGLVVSEPGALPIDPILDASIGATRVSLDQATGEATGFAAAGYPGDVLVNPLSLVSLGFAPEHIITKITKALPIVIEAWPLTAWPVKAEATLPAMPSAKKEIVDQSVRYPLSLDARTASQDAELSENSASASAALDVSIGSPLQAFPQLAPITALASRWIAPYLGGFDLDLQGTFLEARGVRSSTNVRSEGATASSSAETSFDSLDILGGLLQIGPTRAAVTLEGDLEHVNATRREVALGPIRVMGVSVGLDGGVLRVTDGRVPAADREAVRRILAGIMASAGVRVSGPTTTVEGGVASATAFELAISLPHPTLVIVPPGTAAITLAVGAVSTELALNPAPPAAVQGSGSPPGTDPEPVASTIAAASVEKIYAWMAVLAVAGAGFGGWSWRRKPLRGLPVERSWVR